jgi:hypothetical protein
MINGHFAAFMSAFAAAFCPLNKTGQQRQNSSG